MLYRTPKTLETESDFSSPGQGDENFEIGRILHLNSKLEISDRTRQPAEFGVRAVHSEISRFEFEMQDSSNFKSRLLVTKYIVALGRGAMARRTSLEIEDHSALRSTDASVSLPPRHRGLVSSTLQGADGRSSTQLARDTIGSGCADCGADGIGENAGGVSYLY